MTGLSYEQRMGAWTAKRLQGGTKKSEMHLAQTDPPAAAQSRAPHEGFEGVARPPSRESPAPLPPLTRCRSSDSECSGTSWIFDGRLRRPTVLGALPQRRPPTVHFSRCRLLCDSSRSRQLLLSNMLRRVSAR